MILIFAVARIIRSAGPVAMRPDVPNPPGPGPAHFRWVLQVPAGVVLQFVPHVAQSDVVPSPDEVRLRPIPIVHDVVENVNQRRVVREVFPQRVVPLLLATALVGVGHGDQHKRRFTAAGA